MVFAASLPCDCVKILSNEKQWWTQIALCSIKTLNSHLSTKLWVEMWMKIMENWNYFVL